MSVAGWDWWIVVGGLLQGSGILLLVRDVIATHRRLEAYRHRPITLQVHDAMHAQDSATVTLTTDAEPTLEERVGRLEAQLASVRDELREVAVRLSRAVEAAAERAGESANKRAAEQFEALERALLGDRKSVV